jgi:hypothetical protein
VIIAPPAPIVTPRAPSKPPPRSAAAVASFQMAHGADGYEPVSSSELVAIESEVSPLDITPLVAIEPNDRLPSSRPDLLASSASRIDLLPPPSPSPQSARVSAPPARPAFAPQDLLSWSSRPELSSRNELAFLPTPTRPGRVEEFRLESVLGDETPSLPALVRAADFRKDSPLSYSRAYSHVGGRSANDDADEPIGKWLAGLEAEETPLMEVELGDDDILPSSRDKKPRSSSNRPSLDILALPPLGVFTSASLLPPSPEPAAPPAPPTLPKRTSFTVYKTPPPVGQQRTGQDTVVIRRRSNGLGRAIAAGSAVIGLLGVFGLLATTTLPAARKDDVEKTVIIRRATIPEAPASVAAPPAPLPAPASVAIVAPLVKVSDAITPVSEPLVAVPASLSDATPLPEPVPLIRSTLAAADEITTAPKIPAPPPRANARTPEPVAKTAPQATGTTRAPSSSRLGITEVESLTAAADRAYRSGDGTRADELYRRALALSPSFLPARIGVAGVAWDQGRRDEARSRYRAMVDDAPPGLPAYVRDRASAKE